MQIGKKKLLVTVALVVLVFIGLTGLYTRPLYTQAADSVIPSEKHPFDIYFQIYVLNWDIHSLGSNPLNMFNATIFYPNRVTPSPTPITSS